MTDRRLLAYMVTKDEGDRYLDACLTWAMNTFDRIAVYDDQSTDNTVDVAWRHGTDVMVRPDSAPSFLTHEGQFRQRAWRWFEEALEPKPGEWCLALDADEFLVDWGDIRRSVEVAIEKAEANDASAVLLPVPEVFAAERNDDGHYFLPRVRTDGFWGTIAGTRLFRYQPGGIFRNRVMGCGAEPTYVAEGASRAPRAERLSLLHLGYMHPADRGAKHERYTGLVGGHGHADSHVQSIVTPPTLEPWMGPWPAVWRGVA